MRWCANRTERLSLTFFFFDFPALFFSPLFDAPLSLSRRRDVCKAQGRRRKKKISFYSSIAFRVKLMEIRHQREYTKKNERRPL